MRKIITRLDFFKGLFKSKAVLFTANRFLSFILQLIVTTFIAVKLGPYYLGIWGIIKLLLRYLRYLNFGTALASSVLISSINSTSTEEYKKIIFNSFLINLSVGLLLILISVIVLSLNISFPGKFVFLDKMILLIAFVAISNHISKLFMDISRCFGNLGPIMLHQILLQLLLIPLLFIFSGNALIYALLYVTSGTHILSTIIYFVRLPFKIKINTSKRLIKKIFIKGINLLVFEMSLRFIMISASTIVSLYYTLEIVGYYTFSENIAEATLLGTQAIIYIFMPKVIQKIKGIETLQGKYELIKSLRYIHNHGMALVIFTVIVSFPVFLLFLKGFEINKIFTLLIIGFFFQSQQFGYLHLIMTYNREKYMSRATVIAVLINLGLCSLLTYVFKLDYIWLGFPTMFSMFINSYYAIYLGRKILKKECSFRIIFNDLIPQKFFWPILIFMLGVFTDYQNILSILAYAVFLLLNYKVLIEIIIKSKSIVQNNKNYKLI